MLKKLFAIFRKDSYNKIIKEARGKMKKVDIFDVANYFLMVVDRESGSTITPLKLQKLLYYAQGFHLAKFDKPLFKEEFQAWVHGPANYKIYKKYEQYGYESIPKPEVNLSNMSSDIKNFLFEVWSTFGIYDGKYLEKLTHSEAPWMEAIKIAKTKNKYDVIITKNSMMEFFKSVLNESTI